MKKAGIAAVIIGVLLMLGGLYVARVVKSSTVISQIAKYVKMDVSRAEAGKLLETIDILTDNALTDAEKQQAAEEGKDEAAYLNARKMSKLSALHETEYTVKDETVILRGSDKLLKDGFDLRSRMCLTLYPVDQIINVGGMLLILAGGVVSAMDGKQKKA